MTKTLLAIWESISPAKKVGAAMMAPMIILLIFVGIRIPIVGVGLLIALFLLMAIVGGTIFFEDL